MTNKTNYAMFAIAAFAMIGMAMGPAFAVTTSTSQDVNNTPEGQTQYSSPLWDSIDCPYNLTTDVCKQKTKVYNNSGGEKVKVWFNVSGGSAPTCDIRVQIIDDDGSMVLDWSKTNHSGTSSVAKSFSISATDNISTAVTYTNCT